MNIKNVLTILIIAFINSATVYAMGGNPGQDHNRFLKSKLNLNPDYVLSPMKKPYGYSLTEMARKTGWFNSCVVLGSYFGLTLNDCESKYPNTPFQILYEKPTKIFTVPKGKPLYLPIAMLEPTPAMPDRFPLKDTACDPNVPSCYNGKIGSRTAVLDYVFNNPGVNVSNIGVYVDGKLVQLGSDYVVGVNTPLATGTQAYIVIGAFIDKLKKGTHTVGYKFNSVIIGSSDIPNGYTVIVK